MTPEQFTRGLPELTDNPLPIKPPFVFNGMSARVFPLRAHLGTLQRVCDGLLNFVPPQAGYFRVPVPYVFMMVLDYGQVAEAVARIGWFAQIEVFFMVPVEWYKLIGGQWVFHDWAVVTPYVFVDDEFSVPLGRTVYGFPKVLATVTQTSSAWIKDTSAPVTLARVETDVFPETYSGTDIESRVFLEIERNTISNFRVPFDAASPVMPWSMMSHIADAMAGFGRDAMWLAQSMRIAPVNPGAYPGVLPEMLQRMMPWFAPSGKGFVQNSLNLKQFRRSQTPSDICYQSLTNGQMEVTAFNGGGLLGEYPVLMGDLSGGHTVRLYEYPSLPIVRTLGLEVHREWLGAEGKVDELKPVMPFWIDVDIRYDHGENLAWRTDDRVWRDGAGKPFDPQPTDSAAEAPAFNSTVTTAIDEIAGPFEFSDATVRVLPLLAEKAKLQSFVDQYINIPLGSPIEAPMPMRDGKPVECTVRQKDGTEERLRFRVWSRDPELMKKVNPGSERLAYVYLMVSSFGSVISTTNNVGDWTKYQLSFMIPVKFERLNGRKQWELVGVGLVPAFSFVDNCIAAIARLEVQGFQATVANFYKPESVWLSDEVELSANPKQTLLRVDTEVWPALGQGQKATILPVIEISQGDPGAGLGDAPDAAWKWSGTLRSELLAKKYTKADHPDPLKIGRALALELLGKQMPFTAYSLKQFRDAADPARACYQSLVRVPREIKELLDVREIEETLVVRIHNYPSLDIAGTLGLIATGSPEGGSGIVSSAQAIRPFFLRGNLYEPLAQRLGWRAGQMDWTLDENEAFSTLLSDDGGPPITADFVSEALQDLIDPSRISAVMAQAAQRLKVAQAAGQSNRQDSFTKAQARAALERIDPQTVIECILSREWGNADVNTRWRAGRSTLIGDLSALPLTGATTPFAESVLYRQLNNSLAESPGAVASAVSAECKYFRSIKAALATLDPDTKAYDQATAAGRWRYTIEKAIYIQEKFARLRITLEESVSSLLSAAILNAQELESLSKNLDRTPPGIDELSKGFVSLLATLREISELRIEGQAWEYGDLDANVTADQARLVQLLNGLQEGAKPGLGAQSVSDARAKLVAWTLESSGQIRQAVELARAYCGAQNNAFLTKFSRAYQKPDFCIRRDSVGCETGRLLPAALSWDKNWYYGRNASEFNADTSPVEDLPAAAVKSNGVKKRAGKLMRA